MIELWLIGIGAGNPEHVTGEARRAILEADLILLPRKGAGKTDLADLRHQIVDQVAGDQQPPIAPFDMPQRDGARAYLDAVEDWHDAIAEKWKTAIAAYPDARRVALLVWGDPSLYDSTLRIADRLDPRPTLRVTPGVTALQALTAAHAIPLNTVGGSVTITTGRRLRDGGWPDGAETVAVMLDGACAFQTLQAPETYEIWWGAFLGMDNQILRHGRLSEVGGDIVTTRADARAAHGWIMDTYVLRPAPKS